MAFREIKLKYDREITIATGASRKSTKWINSTPCREHSSEGHPDARPGLHPDRDGDLAAFRGCLRLRSMYVLDAFAHGGIEQAAAGDSHEADGHAG